MADNAADNPPPQDTETPPPADTRPAAPGPVIRQPRPRESWEPQQRDMRRPDFVNRLAKTSDLPTEVARERQKSKLGEHRAAAIEWEEGGAEESGPAGTPGPGATTTDTNTPGEGMSRGQIVTLAGLGVVVAVLGVSWFAKTLILGGGAPPLPPPASGNGGAESADQPAALSDIEYAETTEVMTKFLEALTIKDVRPYLREPDRVWPLVEAHNARTPWKPFIVRRIPTKTEVRLNRGLMAGEVEVDDYQRFVVAMERTPDGIKVDWETFTGQGDMSWDDFVSRRPTTPVLMRVALRPDDYYNLDFPDATTHACYQLTSHRDTHRLFGYVERGSPVHAQLSARTSNNPRLLITIRLRFPVGSKTSDQVEIAEIVADGWLVTESTRAKDGATPAATPAATRRTDAGGAETSRRHARAQVRLRNRSRGWIHGR